MTRKLMDPGHPVAAADDESLKPLKTITTVVYGLQAASFVFGVTFVVAVIVNYVKKADVQGTWLASHFRWQIRTFWFSLSWTIVGVIASYVLVGYLILAADVIWVIYRIVKGWLSLADGKAMYAAT